jgi:hypothetical protein
MDSYSWDGGFSMENGLRVRYMMSAVYKTDQRKG